MFDSIDSVTLCIIISIGYLIAMIVGTWVVYDQCENIWGAIILAFIIIPGTATFWFPAISHACSGLF